MSDSTTARKPRILVLSAYDAGSHRRWREQLVAGLDGYEWHSLALPPRYFRWRIRGNALTWLNEPLLNQQWDLLLATSMVDLASIRGFHPHLASIPAVLYMHENQFSYPESEGQHQSVDPQMVNLYSAISATTVVFNSDWNRRSFLAGVEALFRKLPDGIPEGALERLTAKSQVVPVPVEERLFRERQRPPDTDCPHLLWNHRWEYDKGPDRLLMLLDELRLQGQNFRLSVVGEQFRQQPGEFESILERHGDRIVYWGFLADQSQYDKLLQEADVVISTAVHDFQGLSMLEAMASGCLALAPDRLAYPEYVPASQLYPSVSGRPDREAEGAARQLVNMLASGSVASVPDEWRESRLLTAYEKMIHTTLETHRLS
ncbi:DUF3524 domain-containing protein [Marinobacter sp. chi1]|uniref:tRNA-queuosine alpha-mannosyltransferase n=1 Tax=Marinobacter suaedae TaxID=3057675 RepID=A0ABT8W377_9GAMM|nr:DUF3524 domain-containing protein [Marinobacter sp. chi1]MDO3722699.1 DUF3524 domain-containing protein [Marinobacter sp. chi1]